MRMGLTEVVERAERGLLHDRGTRELDNRWAERRGGRMYAQVVTDIDNHVDLFVQLLPRALQNTLLVPKLAATGRQALTQQVSAVGADGKLDRLRRFPRR